MTPNAPAYLYRGNEQWTALQGFLRLAACLASSRFRQPTGVRQVAHLSGEPLRKSAAPSEGQWSDSTARRCPPSAMPRHHAGRHPLSGHFLGFLAQRDLFHKDVCMRCLWCQMFQRREAADPGYQAVIPRVGWCRGVRDRGLSGRRSPQANTEARAWALGSAAEIAIEDSLPETMSWWHAHRAQSASRTAALAAGGYDRPLARLAALRRRSPGKLAAAVRTTQRPVNLRLGAWCGRSSGSAVRPGQVVEALTRRPRRPAPRAAERARRAGGNKRWSFEALPSARRPAPIRAMCARG